MYRRDPEEACRIAELALRTAHEMEGSVHCTRCYEVAGLSRSCKGDFEKALEYYKKYVELSEGVFREEGEKRKKQLRLRFETERKNNESEINRLKNIELQREMKERIQVEKKLREHKEKLEQLIDERTGELTESYKKLERNFQKTVQLISKITELRDPYTSGHQIRVAELASAIAVEMGLPEQRVEAIHIASLVHDIGKINIPLEILCKPGSLSGLEIRMVHMHPQTGFEILSGIDFPWPIAEIVLQHHEHLDGSGYPNGLKEDELLLEARIVAVADVIEAMSSHRPYRPVLGPKKAVREVTDNAGSLYDEEAVEASRRLILEKGFSFE